MTPAGGASGTPGPFASIAFAGITGSPGKAGRRRMIIHPVSRDMNRPSYASKNVLSIERAQGMLGSDRNPRPACKCVFGATDFALSRALIMSLAAARDLKLRVT